jgi:8-oxo-dGTP diphosphatase
MTKSKQVFSKTRYQFIPRVLVFALKNENILLIKGSSTKKVWPNLYNGIGGHIEIGEHPLLAARREFKEETGLMLISPELKAIVTIDTKDASTGISMHVFIGKASEGKLILSDEGAPQWKPLDEIASFPLVEDLPWLIPTIIKNKQNTPIFAQYSYDADNKLIIDFE